jgi:DNA end-binding protein Ku
MYSAIHERRTEFRLLHDQDEVPLRQQMVCEAEDKPVSKEERVKALRVDEDSYTLVEPEELEELAPETDRDIEVSRFVPAGRVDHRYADRAYYLGPDGEAEKYASLAEALGKSRKAGICQWTFRKRSYAGELRSRNGLLELISLRLAGELTDAKELDLPEPKLSQRELKTARYLIDELSGPFEPARYRDEFQDALEKLIAAKARGETPKKRRTKKPHATESNELLDALEGSLEAARKIKGKKESGDGG